MTKSVHRLGDPNTADGRISSIPQNTVYANNILVSVDGSTVGGAPEPVYDQMGNFTGVINPGGGTTTANGSPTVFINNIPVNRIGDPDSDNTPRDTGSPDVFVGP